MNNKSLLTLKTLACQYYGSPAEALVSYLPPEKQAMFSIETKNVDLEALLFSRNNFLAMVHPSWLSKLLSSFDATTQKYVTATLPQENIPKIEMDELWKPFFLKLLLDRLYPQETLPLVLLPPSDLDILTTLSHDQIVATATFLGLNDLAEELRNVIDKNVLKKVYSLLSKEQRPFLTSLLKQKDKIVFQKQKSIIRQIKSKLHLQQLLHRRGLIRLGIALSQEDHSFIWHICHILDCTRGQFVEKVSLGQAPEQIIKALQQQIITAATSVEQKTKR